MFTNSTSSFVNASLVQVFGILTVLGWWMSEEIQNLQNDLVIFQNSQYSDLQKIGIDLLNSVVMEMNYSTSSLKKMPKHRKTAVNFRDNCLLNIFKNAVNGLNYYKDSKLRESSLILCRNCLIFDFIGKITNLNFKELIQTSLVKILVVCNCRKHGKK